MIFFNIKYWFILLLAVAAISLFITYILYNRSSDTKELNRLQLNLLRLLRFLGLFGCGILLLAPFFRDMKRMEEKPIVITAWDNSGSMIQGDDPDKEMARIKRVKDQLVDQLNKEYRVIEYSFGNQTERLDQLDFEDKRSDYSNLLKTIQSNHINENIGAVILGGDGIYNRGTDPIVATQSLNFPVYTLGFGDTTQLADAAITTIRSNRTSFSGNSFPVEAEMLFTGLKGENIRISIWKGDTELESLNHTPKTDRYFYSNEFVLKAGTPGLHEYSVKIEELSAERNKANNISTFAIHVLEKKQRILILSDGPHPDIGAIKNTLDQQKSYEVSLITKPPFPSNIGDFNLVILNQFPTRKYALSDLHKLAEGTRTPFLHIVGNKTFIPQFNTLDPGAQINQTASSDEMAQAILNPSFGLFQLNEDFQDMLPRFPPLLVPYADYELAPEVSTLFSQSLLNIETNNPLIALGNINGRKTGFIFGEGIWRWRLFAYSKSQDHSIFNEFINQITQYLALRENEDNFIIRQKSVFTENNDVVIHAEVYDDNYEKIKDANVQIDISNEDGDIFQFVFDAFSNEYILNAGNLPRGDYSFKAKAQVGEEEYTESGAFKVIPLEMENTHTEADHNLLYQLANNTGGKFFLPEEASLLSDQLKSNNNISTKYFFQERITELIDIRWLAGLLLLLFSVEWFLRKFWGVM